MFEIRPLNPADDRSGFSCGDPALDRYFQYYAGLNQFKLKLSVTYVATLDARIVGFATVAVGSIEKQELPNEKSRRRLPSYPLPILRLARLGVVQSVQGSGIGSQLLRHVFLLAISQRDTTGCLGVVTDSKPNAVPFYERFGFIPLVLRDDRLHGDQKPMFLDIHTIAGSLID